MTSPGVPLCGICAQTRGTAVVGTTPHRKQTHALGCTGPPTLVRQSRGSAAASAGRPGALLERGQRRQARAAEGAGFLRGGLAPRHPEPFSVWWRPPRSRRHRSGKHAGTLLGPESVSTAT